MLKEIVNETEIAIDAAYKRMYEQYYTRITGTGT